MGRKLKKVGAFLKEHWVEIVIGGALIGGGVALVKFNRSRDFDISEIKIPEIKIPEIKTRRIIHDDGFVELGNSGCGFFNEKGVEILSDKFQSVPGKIKEAIRFTTEKGTHTGITFDTPVEKLGEFGKKLMDCTSEKNDTIPVSVFWNKE